MIYDQKKLTKTQSYFSSQFRRASYLFLPNLGRRVRQLGHVRLKGRMRVRNSVCFECDRGNQTTRGKPIEQRGEEHTHSNNMRQTTTVHIGNQTRVLRCDKRVS